VFCLQGFNVGTDVPFLLSEDEVKAIRLVTPIWCVRGGHYNALYGSLVGFGALPLEQPGVAAFLAL